jgi:hypothetical protein
MVALALALLVLALVQLKQTPVYCLALSLEYPVYLFTGVRSLPVYCLALSLEYPVYLFRDGSPFTSTSVSRDRAAPLRGGASKGSKG